MSNMFDPWISVNDCLPETFRPVIICRTIGKGERRVEQGHMDLGGWWKVYGTRTKSVTHWMPLPPPPREMPPMPVTEYCKGCIHLFGTMDHTPLCQYILHAGRCRPCPAGDGCTVKETERTIDMKKRTWDASRARQLYDEGLDDLTIADMVGATEGAIKAWRAANHLKTNVATPKNTEEPQTETTPKMPPLAVSHVPDPPAADEPLSPVALAVGAVKSVLAPPAPAPSAPPRLELTLSSGSCEVYLSGEPAAIIPLLDSARSLAYGLLPK